MRDYLRLLGLVFLGTLEAVVFFAACFGLWHLFIGGVR